MVKKYYYFLVKSKKLPQIGEHVFYIMESGNLSVSECARVIKDTLFNGILEKADIYISSYSEIHEDIDYAQRRYTNVYLHNAIERMIADEFKKERKEKVKQFLYKLLKVQVVQS